MLAEVLLTAIILTDKETKYYTREVPSYVVCKRLGARILNNYKADKGLIICEPRKKNE